MMNSLEGKPVKKWGSTGVALLTVSCDKYSDLWSPHFKLLEKFWPDCPFPRHLGFNELNVKIEGVSAIKIGPDKGWSDNLLAMLEIIEGNYILLLLDDFFMRSRIDTDRVMGLVEFAKKNEVDCLRLVPRPCPQTKLGETELKIAEILPGEPYRISTQGALWRKRALQAILRTGESIWEFEIRGTVRAESENLKIYGTYEHVLTYRHHVIQRGKWFPWERFRHRGAEIGCDFGARETMTFLEVSLWFIKKVFSKASQLKNLTIGKNDGCKH